MGYKLYTGDCSDVMKGWPDSCIDMALTSPPYGDMRRYKGYTFNFEAIAIQMVRTLKEGGVIIWVVGDQTRGGSESGTSMRQALHFMDLGLKLYDTMIYHKMNYPPLTHKRYEQEWEYMFCLSKGNPKTFNPIKLACKKAGQELWGRPSYYKTDDGKLSVGADKRVVKKDKIHGNIFSYMVGSNNKHTSNHPGIFPYYLARDQIASWSNPGDIILDPMCGSGSTGVEAIKMKRRFIGIDISPEYIKETAKALKELD